MSNTNRATQAGDKKIGAFPATMMVVSMMIGSGVYLLPSGLAAIGSISLLGWIAATFGAVMLAGVFSLLAIVDPGRPGLFSYVGDALGPAAGFVSATLYWFACWIGGVGVALAAVGYLTALFPSGVKAPDLTGMTIGFIWLLIGVNLIGARFVARLQSWFLAIGLAPILIVAIFGWLHFQPQVFLASWNVTSGAVVPVVSRSAVMVFWAFLGIECAIVISGLVRNPARDVPIASLGGLVIAAAVYISASVVIMGILPAAALAKSNAPFADAIAPLLGASFAAAVALCAMVKASGTLSVVILGSVVTATSPAMLGPAGDRPNAQQDGSISRSGLILTGILMSLVAAATASPTLARQFTIVANVTVVIFMYVYIAACIALLRLSRTAPHGMGAVSKVLAIGAVLFCVALIASSEPDLLVWSAATIIVAILAYVPVRLRRSRASELVSRARA